MHLRRVEAHGFKSFADRQVFEFGPGLTAVVGPNGSGKSNVADAIRWALGEQSARAIRARRAVDFIFSGSDGRRERGNAEVTLVLDNAGQWMPIDYSEVAVTRRAYRSGESEYLINGQKVRLLDVQDLFRRAQVGQNSYAMMSQGLVDEVLSLRPPERRRLIEEAADVHRHRAELTRAERRLTQTRDNLGHVRVMVRELAPRLRQLERQSKRAERYRELDAQLGAALEAYYETELRQTREALTGAQRRHDRCAEAFAIAQRRAEAFAPEIAAAERASAAARAELERAQRRERELAEQAQALGQQLALAGQRRELLQVRRAEVDAAIAELAAAPEAEDADGGGDGALASLDARAAGADAELGAARAAMQAADGAVREVLRELAEAEARRTRIGAEIADIEARRARAAERRSRREREREEAAARREALLGRLRDYGGRALAAHRERGTLERRAAEAHRRRETAERRLEEARAKADAAREALRAAQTERERLEARRDLIATLASKAADHGSAGQEVLRAAATSAADDGGEALGGVVGIVSELIRTPRGLERAIEAALGERLSAVVVERRADALAAIAHLREREAGAVTMLPLDSVPHRYPLNILSERGVVGVAARLVGADRRYRALIDTLLGRTIVVEDVQTALRTIGRGLGSVVTRDGVLVRRDGTLYGGSGGAAAERFVLQDEDARMPEAIAAARRAGEAAAEQAQRLAAAAAGAQEALAGARDAADRAEAARGDHERAASRLRRGLVSTAGELRLVHAALSGVDAGDGDARAADEAIAGCRGQLADLETELAGLRDRSDAAGAERDAAGAQAAQAAASLAAAEGERTAARERRAAATADRQRRRERLTERREQALALAHELEDLEQTLRELRARAESAESARAAAGDAVAPARAALTEAEAAERELAATRGDSQTRLFAAERELLEAQSTLRELAGRVRGLEQQIAGEGLVLHPDGSVRRPRSEFSPPPGEPPGVGGETGVAPAPSPAPPGPHGTQGVLAGVLPVPASGGAEVDTAELRARISELRGEIRALGPVNVEALTDLGGERERHDFLSGQIADLESAEAQLREAIADLERGIRERFDETFGLVNGHFGEYFRRFFGGGRAELVVVEPEDEDGEAGVDVRAQPPGKRISSLAMLSGGERALTSVALLFALLAVNPAPLCVLDEVDAALDEANVGRFVETLREMCERSQFIVITHNRGTIEAADAIYGVSMGEDSVSRVLSLRLADLPQAS